MTDAVKLLTPRRLPRSAIGGGAPLGHDKYSEEQRENIRYYLEANFLVDAAHSEAEVKALTVAERIQIELEMRERNSTSHSFEYDPLAR